MLDQLRRSACKLARRNLAAVFVAAAMAGSAVAQDVSPPKAYTTTPGGISVSDGNLVYSEVDLAMGPLTLERYHRGGQRQPNYGMFGRNFSSNFDIYIANSEIFDSEKILTIHVGNTATGQYYQSNDFPSLTGPRNKDADKGVLIWNGSKYVYTDSSGTIYTFSSTVLAAGAPFTGQTRRVERIDFPDGRRQTFTYATVYSGISQPRLVEDSSGYAILFDYNANGDVSAACIFKRSETYVSTASTCAGAQLKTTYTYVSGTPRYLLASVVNVLGQTTSYTNTQAGVTCITPPGYGSCKLSQNGGPPYNWPNFGTTQVLADGGTWVVSGQDWEVVPRGDDDAPASENGHVEVYVTDPDNQVTALTFTKSSPFTISDPLGRSTTFTFEGGPPDYSASAMYFWGGQLSFGTMLREAVYPEGDRYQADYNGPFRAVTAERHVPKPGSGLPTLSKTYGYGSCTSPGTYQNCAKPIWIQDPNGNRTNYTYASHGGILTAMAPAPVASGARPLKVTTWVQRYAWVKNSGGTLVQGSLPVWVKNTETMCQTVAGSSPSPVCDGAALQTVTGYEYGANGTGQSLMVKGVVVTADGTSLRTCYGYDPFDRKIFETQPNANLSSCP